MDFVGGGLAGAGATLLTNPIDVIKTRMQLEGELKTSNTKFKGVFHAGWVISSTEGLRALQCALMPAMIFTMLLNGFRLGLYNMATERNLDKTEGVQSPLKVLACSSVCGAVGALCGHPAHVIKVRMQAAGDTTIGAGTKYKYKGTIDAFRTIVKNEGVTGLYAGLLANMLRTFLGSGTQLTVFAVMRNVLVKYDMFKQSPLAVAFVASLLGGPAITVAICPLDVVCSRLYSQGKDDKLYKGMMDCFKKTLQTEGVQGLYKGFWPLYMRIAPHATASLVIWDSFNRFWKEKT